jgi:hypothetical protein
MVTYCTTRWYENIEDLGVDLGLFRHFRNCCAVVDDLKKGKRGAIFKADFALKDGGLVFPKLTANCRLLHTQCGGHRYIGLTILQKM